MSRRMEALWYPEEPPSLAVRALRLPLGLAAGGFALTVGLRNRLHEAGVLGAERVEGLRVISVGNLTAGGAGKTPVVAFLAGRLSAAGAQVAVLTRGHGRTESGVVEVLGPPWPSVERAGDEPLLLGRRLPGVRIWVGADRVDTARRARAAGATVALLDDGFQHRRLARDVDLVVIDEAVGLGTGHLLPWGPLREPASELGRASAVWVRVADRPVQIRIPPGLPVVRARHAAVDLVDPAGGIAPLSRLSGVAVVGFCGIARPSSFERTLRALGAEVRAMHDFPDHHRFSASELLSLRGAAQGGLQLVTTEKDAVRLPADFPAWVVRLGVTVLEGESELARLLAR